MRVATVGSQRRNSDGELVNDEEDDDPKDRRASTFVNT